MSDGAAAVIGVIAGVLIFVVIPNLSVILEAWANRTARKIEEKD